MQTMKTGKGLADYAISKIGVPYFYGCKMNLLTDDLASKMHASYPKTVTLSYIAKARKKKQFGKINTDCSGLIGAFRGKHIGSAQLYSTAKKRMSIADVKEFAPGVVLWKSGHVGVYIGMEDGIPMCVEAKGIDYGVVKSRVASTNWQYGLTFDDMEYSYEKKVEGTSKQKNPFIEPTVLVKRGSKGNDVKWVQWELREAGYDRAFTYNGKTYNPVLIDGDAGKITEAAIKAFQASCKLVVDGKVGLITRTFLKER